MDRLKNFRRKMVERTEILLLLVLRFYFNHIRWHGDHQQPIQSRSHSTSHLPKTHPKSQDTALDTLEASQGAEKSDTEKKAE
jgi:hypothetical protein